MRSPGSCKVLLAVFVALTLFAPSAASAKRGARAAKRDARKRIVVLSFTGSRAAQAENAVVDLLGADHDILSDEAWRGARAKAKVRLVSDARYAKVAAAISADAILSGDANKRELFIEIREGRSGAVTAEITIPIAGRYGPAARRKIAAALATPLAELQPLHESEPAIGIEQAEAEPEFDERAPGLGDAPAETGDGSPPADDTVRARSEAPRRVDPRTAAAEVTMGLSVTDRSMTFRADPALPAAAQPQAYEGDPVGGATFAGELYPALLAGRRGALADVGVAVVYDRVLSMHSTDMTSGSQYATSQSRLGIGLRYRWNLGAGAGSPTVKLAAGWNSLAVAIDSGTTQLDLPDVAYSYLDAGATLRYPLGRRLAVVGGARYLHCLSTGEMQKPENYGPATVRGLDLDAALELQLGARLMLELGARYQRMAYDFGTTGAKAISRDANPDQDVGGAVDRYAGGYLTAGYLF